MINITGNETYKKFLYKYVALNLFNTMFFNKTNKQITSMIYSLKLRKPKVAFIRTHRLQDGTTIQFYRRNDLLYVYRIIKYLKGKR